MRKENNRALLYSPWSMMLCIADDVVRGSADLGTGVYIADIECSPWS